MSTLLILSVLSLGFWVALVADRRRRWPSQHRLESSGGDFQASGSCAAGQDLAVLVPARNEEDTLPETLPSLLSQVESFSQLVVVDDRSSDATSEVARKVIAERGAVSKARVVEADLPPEGWSGKLHALLTGITHVAGHTGGAAQPGWFLFTDADIRHPPDSVAELRAKAAAGSYDFVSVMVRLHAGGFWEKLLIPPFVFFFQLLYPFRRVSDRRSKVAAAAGGCVLISRRLLEALGGLEAVRDAVIDDVALARRAKAAGGNLWLGFCTGMESLREYRRLGEILSMVARTAFTQLKYSYTLVLVTLLALVVFVVSPPFVAALACARGEWWPFVLALATWGVQAGSLLPAVRYHRVHPIWSTTLPFAGALYGWATLLSAWNHACGRGVCWRGRTWLDGKDRNSLGKP